MLDINGQARKGNWMQTATGKQFWPLDPRADEIDLTDVASALSRQCRYSGHCTHFYSVAEHSVHMYRYARDLHPLDYRLQREVLFHDASEAYLTDVIRPIKPYLKEYYGYEADLMKALAERFVFDYPLSDTTKWLDTAILHDEMLQVMAKPPAPWPQIEHPPLDVKIECWSPGIAFHEFMHAAKLCGAQ